MVAENVQYSFLDIVPIPHLKAEWNFLAHAALRLTCNHEGYAPLWKEQLGAEWREASPRHTWPVLAGEEARWEVRAAIDAVVAQAYGLNRAQYEHVLHSFDRASGTNPHTAICLAKWDELQDTGLSAFTQKYDPYWDIPLIESLPEPVIELPSLEPNIKPGQAVQRDLFGNVVQTNLFGEVVMPGSKKKRRK